MSLTQVSGDVVSSNVIAQALTSNTVPGSVIVNNSITAQQIANSTITPTQISTVANTQVIGAMTNIGYGAINPINLNTGAVNWGIGTSSPTKTLEVLGTIKANTASGGYGITIGNAGNSFAFNRDVDVGTIFNPSGFAYQWQKTSSATATSDNLALQVYSSSGTQVTASALAVNGNGDLAVSGTVLNSSGRPMVKQTGGILQVVQGVLNTTTTLVSNGTPTNVTGLSATITPSSTSSRIYIILQIMYGCAGTTYGGYFTRNGTAIGQGVAGSGQQQVQIGMAFTSDNNQTNTFVGSYIDSPASTSALTYQFVTINDNSNTLYINRSVTDSAGSTGKRGISTVTLMEIAG